ncbi:prefoldin [Kipferlia bialata]|uniref:Prefoldin n=1 Tax=Kipferlia bialata TaxID=797122 RepID=A0A391NXV6_9EUKA|nr:prefoldin [Kipferlia bialata]|eukprot:g9054.t1
MSDFKDVQEMLEQQILTNANVAAAAYELEQSALREKQDREALTAIAALAPGDECYILAGGSFLSMSQAAAQRHVEDDVDVVKMRQIELRGEINQ